jgi:hypothetical protein
MTLNDAKERLVQATKHMEAAGELAQRILAETPKTTEYQQVRRHARYITSGVLIPTEVEEAAHANKPA